MSKTKSSFGTSCSIEFIKERKDQDKIITFPLIENFINISFYQKLGYQRSEVFALFEELQGKGYGVIVKGKIGGKSTSFEPNATCPQSYTITVKVKSMRKNYAGCPDNLKIINNRPKSEIENSAYKFIDDLRNETRIPNLSTTPYILGSGYVCSYTDQHLFVDKIVHRGYKTIEEAVEAIWDEIEDKISDRQTKYMSKMDFVISALKGFSVYKLDHVDEVINAS